MANTCASVGWYRTRSPGENILGLKQGHNTLYTRPWRENITEYTQVTDLKQWESNARMCVRRGTQTTAIDIAWQNSEVTRPPRGGGNCKGRGGIFGGEGVVHRQGCA